MLKVMGKIEKEVIRNKYLLTTVNMVGDADGSITKTQWFSSMDKHLVDDLCNILLCVREGELPDEKAYQGNFNFEQLLYWFVSLRPMEPYGDNRTTLESLDIVYYDKDGEKWKIEYW